VLVGWPEQKSEVPIHFREYWNQREEISRHNGILFNAQRIIIPKTIRDFLPSNPNEPMWTTKVPDRPWSRVAVDMFTLQKRGYVFLGDYYSDFEEVQEISDTTSPTITHFLKEQFSRHGIPEVFVLDSGPQLTSDEFRRFAEELEFKHVTSSPHHHKSNGKAESAVKVTKNLFKTALRDGRDPWLALLEYRNTPVETIGSSPLQRLMSRRTKTMIPTASALLRPRVVEGV